MVKFIIMFLGNDRWPPGCNLRLLSGVNLSNKDIIIVDAINANEIGDISVELTSPKESGMYQCQYRLFTPTGTPFGGGKLKNLDKKLTFINYSFKFRSNLACVKRRRRWCTRNNSTIE